MNFNNWKDLPRISVFLVGYALGQFFFTPLSNIPLVLNKTKVLLLSNMGYLLINLICYLMAFIFDFDFFIFLFLVSFFNFFYVLFVCLFFIKLK